MNLQISPAAERELSAAVDWYEARVPGLGLELLVEVDRVLSRIVSRPFEAALWRADRQYRKKLLDRFPYVIFFRTDGHAVVVDAFAHVRRRPGFWTKR